MTRLVSAIPVIAERTGRAVVLVGGLAVMCRLSAPYRVSLELSVEGLQPLTVHVSEPGPILAMKLQSIMNRGAAKEGTDLLDIVRISLI
jgi:hypothetical protein